MESMTCSVGMDVTDDAPASFPIELEAYIDAFNAIETGIADARSLSIIMRHPGGDLRAGLHGHTWGGTCQIRLLWVRAPCRLAGLGSALLKAAEKEARRRGCRQIMLSTHSFQAPGFYTRHGFEQVATIADNPLGHADILMLKRLADDGGD
jgi:GNAT superfamily N-acetyltransferase